MGWFKDSEIQPQSTRYQFNEPITDNLTLYAKWVPGGIIDHSDETIKVDSVALEQLSQSVFEYFTDAEGYEPTKIVVDFDFDEWNPKESDAAIIDQYAGAGNWVGHDIYLKCWVDDEEYEIIEDTENVIIPITYDLEKIADKSNVAACRVHNGEYCEFTSTPNADGEYAVVDEANDTATVYAKKFSTYGFKFSADTPDPGDSGSDSATSANTGDTNSVPFEACAVLSIVLIGLMVYTRRKKRN